MATPALDTPILDVLIRDFGGNYFFALDLFAEYERDRHAVDASWREYFDNATGRPAGGNGAAADTAELQPVAAAPAAPVAAAAPATEPAATASSDARIAEVVTTPPPSLAKPATRAMAVPTILPGDIAQPIRGGALRIVENMEASLTVPTATSIRTHPGAHARGEPRASSTSTATPTAARQGQLHAPRGLGHPARPRHVPAPQRRLRASSRASRTASSATRCGSASRSTCRRRTARRTLLVPNIKDANKLDFAGFLKAFDDAGRRARARARSRPTTSWARRSR